MLVTTSNYYPRLCVLWNSVYIEIQKYRIKASDLKDFGIPFLDWPLPKNRHHLCLQPHSSSKFWVVESVAIDSTGRKLYPGPNRHRRIPSQVKKTIRSEWKIVPSDKGYFFIMLLLILNKISLCSELQCDDQFSTIRKCYEHFEKWVSFINLYIWIDLYLNYILKYTKWQKCFDAWENCKNR